MDNDEFPPIFPLNDDCLEQIFWYLDAPSLIEVWNVCKRFRTVADPLMRVCKLEFNLEKEQSLSTLRLHMKHAGKYVEEISVLKRFEPVGAISFHH